MTVFAEDEINRGETGTGLRIINFCVATQKVGGDRRIRLRKVNNLNGPGKFPGPYFRPKIYLFDFSFEMFAFIS